MAKLLYFPSSKDAISFCKLLQLPVGVDAEGDEVVLFKTAPISTSSFMAQEIGCTKRHDDFVFAGILHTVDYEVDSDGVRIPCPDLIRSLVSIR